EPHHLQVDHAQHDLGRRDGAAQRERPAAGDGGERVSSGPVGLGARLKHLRRSVENGGPCHARPPCVSMTQSRMAMASASLSSTGEKTRARAAAIIAALSALPLPVACRLMVPTGTP